MYSKKVDMVVVVSRLLGKCPHRDWLGSGPPTHYSKCCCSADVFWRYLLVPWGVQLKHIGDMDRLVAHMAPRPLEF